MRASEILVNSLIKKRSSFWPFLTVGHDQALEREPLNISNFKDQEVDTISPV